MVHHYLHSHTRHQRLYLVLELGYECRLVMHREVGHHIYRDASLLFIITETVHLNDILMFRQCLHDGVLQLGSLVIASGNGIDTDS